MTIRKTFAKDVFFMALAVANASVGAGDGGFYRTRSDIDGRWWMVDPAGHDTLMIGVDHVRHMGWWCEATNRKEYEEANVRRFGTRERWESDTLSRLRDWGFNLLGVGHDGSLRHRGLAHGEILHLGDGFVRSGKDRAICPNPNGIPSTAFPDVFHPDFPDWCRRQARKVCVPMKDDRDLLGYFLDNELCWWGLRGDPPTGLFETVSAMPEGSPAWKALEKFVSERGGLRDFETKRAFLRLCAKRYFEITTAAVRAADPNHLILGCRFANLDGAADLCVWEEAGKTCDVVSFNCYAWADLDRHAVFFNGLAGSPRIRQMWDDVHHAAQKPLMVTEWSFPALDVGLPCSNGAGQRMRTQAERAEASELFARSLLASPYMIGYVYFMWLDQPKEGITRAFPENSNYGLVSGTGKVHKELVDALGPIQRDAVRLHRAPYPAERDVSPPAEVRADEAFRMLKSAARSGCAVDFRRMGNAYRISDGAGLVLSGTIGGEVFSSVEMEGEKVGRFTSMLCVRDGECRWLDARRVTAVSWEPSSDGRIGTLHVKAEGGEGECRFETSLAVSVVAGCGKFLCALTGVRNLGAHPLDVVSFFFREYPAFRPGLSLDPPAGWVWKGVPGSRWVSAKGLVYGGESRSQLVRKFRYFMIGDAALPDAEFALPENGKYAVGESRMFDGRIWMLAYVERER